MEWGIVKCISTGREKQFEDLLRHSQESDYSRWQASAPTAAACVSQHTW